MTSFDFFKMTRDIKDSSDPPLLTEVKVNPLTSPRGLEPETSTQTWAALSECPVQYSSSVWVICGFSHWRDFNDSWNLIYDLTTSHFSRKCKQIWEFTKVPESGLFINGYHVKVLPLEYIILPHWIAKIARMPTAWWLMCELLNELCKVCAGRMVERARRVTGQRWHGQMNPTTTRHQHQAPAPAWRMEPPLDRRSSSLATTVTQYETVAFCILVLTGLQHLIWESYQKQCKM